MNINLDRHKAGITRRALLQVGTLGMMAGMARLLPSYARASEQTTGPASTSGLNGETIDLMIDETPFRIGKQLGKAKTINGTIPGPLIRLQEGDHVTLHVANRLKEGTSIHWHGLLLPPEMDGVPGVSFGGIEPGTTFTYRFPVKQSGTYWFHSHSGGQELLGMYAPMIIDPIEPEPFRYDRDYVVMLSDWTFESPETVFSNLKKQGGYYNFQKRAAREFFDRRGAHGLLAGNTKLLDVGPDADGSDGLRRCHRVHLYLSDERLSPRSSTGRGCFVPASGCDCDSTRPAMTFYDVRCLASR